jgi:hypothetical protein
MMTNQSIEEERMSNRHRMLRYCGLLTLGFLSFGSAAMAQEKPAKELIVGTWTLSIADHVLADGTKTPGFGPLPSGTATFGTDGRYSVQITPNVAPALASAEQRGSTVGAGQAPAQAAVSESGTYTLDESQKILTLRIEQSSLPNWGGTTQVANIKFLVGDDLGWSNPKPLTTGSAFTGTDLIWRRAK